MLREVWKLGVRGIFWTVIGALGGALLGAAYAYTEAQGRQK